MVLLLLMFGGIIKMSKPSSLEKIDFLDKLKKLGDVY